MSLPDDSAVQGIAGIAVIGLAGRFPGADSVDRFWENLAAGRETITFWTPEELRAAGVDPRLLDDPAYVRARGLIDGPELFDAAFFGLSPREAEIMDPQHRLLLECSWQALEHAGYDPQRYAGPIGIYAGAGSNTYLLFNLISNRELIEAVGHYQAMLGSGGDFLATRISYKLNLTGPSLTVQTACSTSLVAVHLAAQSLLNGECDIALAGGVRISVPQRAGYLYRPDGIQSPDGHCRPFDAAARGFADGDGVGIVVLKRLADALADGDHVHAVILGSAINNDGGLKIGYTAPSVGGQAQVIAMAQAVAEVPPGTIGYLEAHGTATPMGDPIELAALAEVFNEAGAAAEVGKSCALGSVKGNIGHLDAAAGVAGLIKAVLGLEHRQLPPSLHFERPNPQLHLDATPFFVNTRLVDWPAGETPRRAGVSSFGIGGTNAHVVLEEAPEAAAGSPSRHHQLLLLSAATATALEAATANLVDHLRRHPPASLADVAYTLQVGRRAFPHRRMLVCASAADAVAALDALDPKRVLSRFQETEKRRVTFMFPGQGAQHAGMAAELYRSEPTFRREVDLCAEILRPLLGLDLRAAIHPAEPGPAAEARLAQTALAQPALFVVEYALARLWMEWGVRPEAMIGHSIGELVAACLAGVFTREEALLLVAERGRLMQAAAPGAMLSVSLGEEELRPWLAGGLEIAAVNTPSLAVVAGAEGAITDLAERLAGRGIQHRRLHTSHAFHSASMEAAVAGFRAAVARLRPRPPEIPFLSNRTGTWIRPEEATDADYWAGHLRHAVRFSEGLEKLFAKPGGVLLEVGPGRSLAAFARQHPARPSGQPVLSSLPAVKEAGAEAAAAATMLRSLGQLWLAGVDVDWAGFYAEERRRRAVLPTYPFERQRFWVEAREPSALPPAPEGRRELADWFYAPLWKQALLPAIPSAAGDAAPAVPWLVFVDEAGLGERLVERLRERGVPVASVRAARGAERFAADPDGRSFALRPGAPEDYAELLARLGEAGLAPGRIAHLWSVTPAGRPPAPEAVDAIDAVEAELELGFYSLLFLAQALAAARAPGENALPEAALHLGIVSTGLQSVTGEEALQPGKAALLGPAVAIPLELPGVTCQSLDVTLPEPGSRRERELVDHLLAELAGAPPDPVVALRGSGRWLRIYEPLGLLPAVPAAAAGSPPPLRDGGTYLITGGLGGVGLELAELLARSVRARIVLTGRAPFPPREEWERRAAANGTGGRTEEVIRRLLALEELGAEVLVARADVTDREAMAAVLALARARFGPLHGVIHAAGVAGGGLIQLKTRQAAAAVLAPKVAGTLVLAGLLAGEDLDFLALCSSLTAILGAPGQADYAAANAFLDAFAAARAQLGEGRVLAISWDAWRGVGMAAGPAAAAGRPAEPAAPPLDLEPFGHPLLTQRAVGGGGPDAAQEETFLSHFDAAGSWFLAEHRLGGQAIVPGTVYLEMAGAAFRGMAGLGAAAAIEISDVLFVAPMRVEDDERREVRTVLRRNGDGFHFNVRSGPEGERQEHVVGSIRESSAPPARYDLAALRAGRSEQILGEEYLEQLRSAGLGPRWESLKQIWVGEDGVLGLLELAPELSADVEQLQLHPALLDVATCLGESYVPRGEGYYLPLSYRRLRTHGPLPRRCWSHVRFRSSGRGSTETLAFDVAILDEEGVERVGVEEFTLKRLNVAATIRRDRNDRSDREDGEHQAALAVAGAGGEPESGKAAEGMDAAEGAEAFRRILTAGRLPRLPQVAVSTHWLPEVIARARELTLAALVAGAARPAGAGHARPDLETAFVAPRNDAERRLAGIWQEILGVETIGVFDNFFELGGHSLLGTQLISRVRADFQVEVPLARLFEAATVADFAAAIESERADAGAGARGGGADLDTPPLVHQEQAGDSPLSFAQQRLWFLDRFDPGSAAYNMPRGIRLIGALDAQAHAALAASFSEIVRRHEILRTSFHETEGEPVQAVAPPAPLPLPLVDLAGLAAESRERESRRLGREAARLPFDLARGPLIRTLLLRLAPDEHIVSVVMHHIVTDGWSMGVFVREMWALYPALRDDLPSPLPELPIQYGDFAVWQRLWLQGRALTEQLDYWQRRLANLPEELALPLDRPRPAVESFRQGIRPFVLPAPLAAELTALTRRHGATAAMTLLAGFQALLSRYSGQEDLAVGSPIAGRNRREIENLIGFFVNTLVFRGDLSGDPGFGALLDRVRQSSLEAYANQDLPFEKLVEELHPERSLQRHPIFQVMFGFETLASGALAMPGLTLAPLEEEAVDTGTAKFDLTMLAFEQLGSLQGLLEYNAELLEAATIQRLLGHFETLLAHGAADPGRPLAGLPLLAAAELQQLREWNAPAGLAIPQAGLHELFEAQAARTPEAVAVEFEGEALTYAQLDARAGRLARHLVDLGVGPEVLVGICAERSLALVTGLLAILKAGGAYVPLDPDHPGERLSFVLAEAGIAVLLVGEGVADRLPENAARTVRLDAADPALTAHPAGVAGPPAVALAGAPESLAYVIYTSGSTGRPKGAMNAHRAVVNRLAWMQLAYPLDGTDAVLQKTPYSFDVSVWELFWPLAVGARLVMALPGGHQDPDYLVSAIERGRITTLHFVPSMLQAFLETPGLERCASLRRVIASGEALPADLVATFFARLPWVELHNLYGPTEAAIDVTAWPCEPAAGSRAVPIGRPIANLRIHLLDAGFTPVPAGVAGELYIGGAGVARGYVRRPDLTAERFLPEPLAAEPGARMYRTGDLARYRPDGAIEYLGRIDHQVKIRGFRIELGEIEAVLATHPAVRQSVVLARTDPSGSPRLVAYVVAREGTGPAAEELSRHLAAALPAYMVPASFVLLAALPLSHNGKVDRKQLPAPAEPTPRGDDTPDSARTPVERRVGEILAAVLGLPRVGLRDNFFDLGGHSLLATRAVSRLRQAFGVEVPLRAFFNHPTAAGLAQVVAESRGEDGPVEPPLVPVRHFKGAPLSFAQQRLWFLDQLEPASAAYNLPRGILLGGALAPRDRTALAASFTEIVRRHEILRTTFHETEDEPVQSVSPPFALRLPLVDLTGLAADRRDRECSRLSREAARLPFDLSRGPLIRTLLIRLAADRHVVSVAMHHIVTDGWSMGVFVREMWALYPALRDGLPSPLPELPIQYSDFAVWQRQWLQGRMLVDQLEHWKRRLADLPEELSFPLDRPRPAAGSFRGGLRSFTLPATLAGELLPHARRHGATLAMTLLAGFQALLGRYSGQQDIVVGSPIAGRNRHEIENLIGFFVNTLVFRGDLSGDPGFGALLDRVRQSSLEAYANQDLPFEKLVEELHPERSLQRHPIFQVMFGFEALANQALAMPGLTLSPLEEEAVDTGVAKFDLGMSAFEQDGSLHGLLEYNAELLEAVTIQRLIGRFQMLLEAVAADPELRLSELPLLTEAERQQLLEWGGNEIPETDPPLPRQLAEQARRSPGAVAIRAGEESLTYAELFRRSGLLAERLKALGVGAEARVALCAGRSSRLAVGILGIWQAGGAYVPLDPSLPAARLSFLLEDSGARVLLIEPDLAGLLPAPGAAVELLGPAEAAVSAAGEPASVSSSVSWPVSWSVVDVKPGDLAYLIYTSGTTGRPKAVLVEHGHLAHTFAACRRAFGFRAGDRMPCIAPFSFDIFLFELLNPLLAGGSVEIFALRPTLDVEALTAALTRSTHFHAVPALMRQVVDSARAGWAPEAFAGLRELFVGGDAVPAELLTDLRDVFPQADLHVLYGPTEATIICSTYRVPAGEPRPLLGRPLPGSILRLCDFDGNEVPVGVTGEIWIGGGGVTRGYLDRPDLTAEKLVPAEAGRRWYRTGDLARRLNDGLLEFLGRADHQVKIRGFRIEPGEIEAVLATHPAVRQSVVLARTDPSGSPRLVAYVVAREGTGPAAEELSRHLAAALPAYMVPASFVPLPALPLGLNGKVDRKQLPAPAEPAPRGDDTPDSARTPVERRVGEILAAVLGLPRVGLHDNFFDLGGHSLLATRAVSSLRRAFGAEVPLRALFSHPTAAGLAQVLAEAHVEGVRFELPLVQDRRSSPLSFAQQRLWFLDQMEPESPVYNVPSAVELAGRLSVPTLAAAFGEVVRRHEALRTTFQAVAGEPMQVVAEPAGLALPLVDLAGLAAQRREGEAQRLAGAEARRPFDLGRGPLLRVALLRLEGERHVALVTLHHIVSDGWSMGVLVRELGALYAAFLAGAPSPLPELAVQYADFAVWQRRLLSGEHLESELAWWRRQLAGRVAALELPTDHPRPPRASGRGAVRGFAIDEAGLAGLTALSRRHGATLFMTLLAGFLVLLQRYSGEDDLTVGTPIAGRTRIEIEPLIGFFVNTLALRVDLSGAADLAALLERVRETTLSSYAHQEVPFERLVEELVPERDLSRPPLVQVLLVLQNTPEERLELPGLSLTATALSTGTAKLELTCTCAETGRGLEGTLEYSRDLFEGATIERLAGHFTSLLAAAAADPQRRLAELPLLSAAELHQLREEWNDSALAAQDPPCVHHLIARQALRSPDATAVVGPGGRLTFGELVARAGGLARRLGGLGVGPEARVALFLDRSVEAIAAVVGVLAAGGAYVPVDPAYPAERVAWLLADSRARVVVTTSALAGRLPEGTPTLLVDEPEEGEWPGDGGVGADHPAYIIYTSGSTGRPKGVVIRHGGVVNLMRGLRETAYRGETGPLRVSINASLSFDASVQQVVQLAWGHALHVLPQEVRQDPAALVDFVRRHRLDVLDCTPSQLGPLLAAGLGEGDAAPDLVLVGGEAVGAELRDAALARTRSRFWNVYGPTECTVEVTATALAPGSPSRIGLPLPNSRGYVVAGTGGLAPLSVTGELQLGGAGLARGYLGRPELTAERFVPDPFSGDSGARLYRTGDLARRLPDGSLDILGRMDHQVKVRGFRIELGEIESALSALPGVREGVVIIREDTPGDRRLVAYVTGEGSLDGGSLRRPLRDRLPEFMVPEAFVHLAALPLTPNGKVDRQALPKPERGPAAAFVAPRTPVEEILAAIWAEVLGTARAERVGAHDDFFALGGHSLLATQVISRVREAFGVEMPLRTLFEASTVAALAARIGDAGGPQAPPIVPVPRTGLLPLSFAQQRLWFLDRLAPDNPFYNMCSAVRLSGALAVTALRDAFSEIVRRHESLRTTFQVVDGRPVQAIAPAAGFDLPVIDLAALAGEAAESRLREELSRLVDDESQRPFDLLRGPVFRAQLVRHGAGEHTLLVSLHHIVSDGWSMGVLFSELATLYGAFAAGDPSPLPELPIQYADFALWQREWLQGSKLAAELGYWRQQLAGIPEALELPGDHPRPAVESFRGGAEAFALPAPLVRELTALTRRHNATLSMTTLAGFQALLGRYAGREDVATGVAIANRTRREVEGLIGFFVNTLVMRADLSGSPGFATLLDRARETALGAYAHQDMPFERLVEELEPERDLGRNPLIQVMFGYQNYPQGAVEVQGLLLSPPQDAQVAVRTAKFDLSFFLFEDGDRLVGALEYNSDLFEATTIRRLLGHFENLLAAAAADPGTAVARLSLLAAAERHQLAREWNDTGSAYPAEASLAELFAAQVRRTPDAPALRFAGAPNAPDAGALSYRELDRRAARLARRLRDLGVGGAGPESRVALCLERSPEMVVGILGILQAGGAYVPLDPSYPRERLELLLHDSGASALVTVERWLPVVPLAGPAGAATVCLDGLDGLDGDGTWEEEPAEAAGTPRVPAASLAYIMFTSGSTGEPKGVAVTYQGVVRLVRETSYARFAPDDVLLQIAPFTFDASTPEIWGALLNGACLVVAPPGLLSLAEIEGMLTRYGVTLLHLTAGLFNQVVDENPRALAGLRLLLTGGDVMSASHARRLAAELPGLRLLNMYGPTENTTFTCFHPIAGMQAAGASVPLGRPIANTSVHLLDPHGQPVPIGVPGELLTGGDGLARGYLGRPDLTAERFVPNPFAGDPGEPAGSRLYATGDLARRFPDGRIEFLGRIDQQVKIRGFRIEPGEIESRLGEHPAVLQNVVLAREDLPGHRHLVAYVVQNPAYEVAESGVEGEQVAQWSELFDGFYGQEAAGSDPTLNLIGWNSSYTALPLPRNEMEDWLADTVERIAALAPRRVLEIGCGTGMILFRIAPRCELYVGTDFSAQAIAYVERQLGRVAGIDRSRVRLLQRSAEQLDGIAAGSLDTVIVNSVVQYFPSADYLAEVLTRAVGLVRPGGAIFLGDVRSLPLLEAFHTSVELFQAAPETPLSRLRQRVQTRRLQENELVVDPAFFAALQQRLPGIARVEVHAKHGRAHNELTAFRYQVVLRLAGSAEGAEPAAPPAAGWLDWRGEGLDLAALRERLASGDGETLGLSGVPNARVAAAAAATRLLREADENGLRTAGDLRRRADAAAADAVDPQELLDLAAELAYEIELGWGSPGSDGRFDAVLRRRGGAGDGAALGAFLPAPELREPTTNNPLQERFARRIAPELRAFLKARLPDYMVPSFFVLLDAMPLTPNEKVDRRRLPAPEIGRLEGGKALVAPRNAIEERLVGIWMELLGIEEIGVDHDFFELGGHSLLATQVVSRMREAFGVELPLRAFFAAATVAGLAAEVAELRRLGGEMEAPPVTPVARDGRLPLSFAQERLWFLHRLNVRTQAYNESVAFRLEGRLDEGALRWSLDELLRRHESLRTSFPEVGGEVVQRIHRAAAFEIPSVDLRALPAEVREAEARRLALERALHPFDLERGPLVRGLLVRLAEEGQAVLFSWHHIVSDGWSTGIFVRELSALYAARLAGAPSPLPPLPLQYADFAAWQRRWLRGEVLERQLAYWRRQLAQVAVLDLPTDRPRPVLPRAASEQRPVTVPAALTQRLRAFSRGRGITPFMALLAAFQALLHRYAGQDDVAVGSPIANRNRGEVEKLIGFFINMLVLRTDLAGDPTFGELVDRVRRVAVDAYAHQDLPFEKLVEELRPDRDLRRTPLFQVSFQLLNVPASSLDLPGLSPRPLDFAARSAKFDLDLALLDGGEQLDGMLDYDADLFDAATMERLLAHLERLLAGGLESPGTRLSELPLLSPAETMQLVEEWNDTRSALPPGLRLHERFEGWARRTPEAVALELEGEELSYAGLDARANRLARALRRWGVGPDVRVGLALERSLELVVGVLATLKAGGTYVPLDPAYPRERLAFMLADSRVPVLLTQERLLASLPAGEARVFCLDSQWEEVAAESAAELPPAAGDHALAYVIYTSGSTGRPKGAMNSHRAICNRLLWIEGVDPLTPEDRVLQKTPFSFDVSVWELFWPLSSGARLVLARPGGHQEPDYLVRLVQRAGITTIHFVPSMLQVFLEAADLASCPTIVRVVCGGEALTGPLARRFFSRYPEGAAPRLYNQYGPTEAAIEVTAWRSDPESPLAAVPIGRPIANTSAHVLDSHLRPVAIGIPGELYIGGVPLGRGYLDRPELTAERFIPDPFAPREEAGARLYRTGDQVRRLPGGEIVYLGRLDHQVKVRGFRIELGEIESALASLPGVREAVVVAREETPGDSRLVAYLTGDFAGEIAGEGGGEAQAAGVDALRQQLREHLPEFMVPTTFVHLPALPLNPSGKVDRKALPAPERGAAAELVLPRTPIEEVLAEIWQEALGIERVGVHDNFFALGGHSLLAVLLMARIEKRFGRNLPLATLFAAPTLEALAALLGQSGHQPRRSSLVAIKPQGDRTPFFCVHPIGGNVLCYLDLAHQLPPEQPFYALQSPDPAEGETPGGIEEMAARYLRELRRVQPEGPYRLGGWSMGGLIAFEMARQLAREGSELDLVALIDTPPPPEEPGPSPTEDELVAAFAQDLIRLMGHEPAASPAELPPGTPAAQLEQVARLGQEAGVLPKDFGVAQLQPLFETFAANFRASRAFVRRSYPGSVTLFVAEQTLSAHGPEVFDGWRRSALGGADTSTLPGDHYDLLRRPRVERLARELDLRLAALSPALS